MNDNQIVIKMANIIMGEDLTFHDKDTQKNLERLVLKDTSWVEKGLIISQWDDYVVRSLDYIKSKINELDNIKQQ